MLFWQGIWPWKWLFNTTWTSIKTRLSLSCKCELVGVHFPINNHRRKNMHKLQGLVSTKWTSWHLSNHRMIHVYCRTLRSGQNNQRSLCDTRLGALESLWAKATNGRPEGQDMNDKLTQDVWLWQKRRLKVEWNRKKKLNHLCLP